MKTRRLIRTFAVNLGTLIATNYDLCEDEPIFAVRLGGDWAPQYLLAVISL